MCVHCEGLIEDKKIVHEFMECLTHLVNRKLKKQNRSFIVSVDEIELRIDIPNKEFRPSKTAQEAAKRLKIEIEI